MANRKAVILQKLMKDGCCTIKELSLLCDVSYRTIQNDIQDINHLFHRCGSPTKIITQSGVGTVLENPRHPEIEEMIAKLQKDSANRFTEQDKAFDTLWITFRLLQSDYLKIDDLCEELSLSRSVISKLLPDCRSLLQKWNIAVQSKPHYGLYCEASENDIRQYMFEQLVRKKDEERSALLGVNRSVFFTLRENIVALIQTFDVFINDSILEQMLLYIEIMTDRVDHQHTFAEMLSMDRSSFEYILSQKIALQIESHLNQKLSKEEISWIYRFIVGKCLKKKEDHSDVDQQLLEEILLGALDVIQDKYGYDFHADMELYASLSLHLRALLKRMENDNYSINPMLGEIKMYSLLAYDMAVDISILIDDLLQIRLPDDEISYFAIYLHLAIERKKQKIVPRKTLVVCPSGKGMSELVSQYLKKQFGRYISVLKTCGYYDLASIDFSQYDYIFTMTPLPVRVPLPVIEFSLNENHYHIKKTKMKLLGQLEEKPPLILFTPPALFFPDLHAETKDDALSQLIEKVAQQIPLNPGFYDSVIKRENVVSTELDHGFAIPHPIDRDMAERSFFAVAILSNPIIWRRRKVSIILLTYIKGDTEHLERFYDSFAQLIADKEYAVSLMAKPTYDNLVEIAEKIHQETNM